MQAFPQLIAYDVSNSLAINTVNFPKLPKGKFLSCVLFAYLTDLFRSQFTSTMTNSIGMITTLALLSVKSIALVVAKIQMIWINTGRHIAFVQHRLVSGNVSLVSLIRKTMSKHPFAIANG